MASSQIIDCKTDSIKYLCVPYKSCTVMQKLCLKSMKKINMQHFIRYFIANNTSSKINKKQNGETARKTTVKLNYRTGVLKG